MLRLKSKFMILFPCAVILTVLISCSGDYSPKPRGYFRIALPEKKYTLLDSIYPYTFEYPVYARIHPDEMSPKEIYWINIDYPQFKGTIHISYRTIENNLQQLTEDSRSLVLKHIPKSSGIFQKEIRDKENNVYGVCYEISGVGAASPYQFYLTDSTRNFLRGALYFTTVPNNDSLSPVIDFVKQDIAHLISTFRWKNRASSGVK
ncbi:MAG TPA: gliding motility lipoprotein GldD [Bacteroidales bacterium]|nr:gliding motility lipoprotein GldD [Bacteroidales bacterium]HPT01618.1 gliding motility lipoprotein GldD [Bacteroidales bacterium]